jgi:hypothetical protein
MVIYHCLTANPHDQLHGLGGVGRAVDDEAVVLCLVDELLQIALVVGNYIGTYSMCALTHSLDIRQQRQGFTSPTVATLGISVEGSLEDGV